MNPAQHQSESSLVIGHIDYTKDNYAYGWALNQAVPSQKVLIEVVCNGRVVALGAADQYRGDLEELGIGDGHHGFTLRLSKELLDGEEHQLIARAAQGKAPLQGGPISFGPHMASVIFDEIPRNQGLSALVEIITKTRNPVISGMSERLIAAYEIASLAQETGKTQDAEFAWTALSRVLGVNALCQCKLAENKLEKREYENALALYKNAASLDFSYHWAHLGISNALAMTGDFTAAIKAIEIAITLQPKVFFIHQKLVDLKGKELSTKVDSLVARGLKHEAISLLRQELKFNGSSTTAQELLKNLITPHQDSTPFIKGMDELKKIKSEFDKFEKFINECELRIKGANRER